MGTKRTPRITSRRAQRGVMLFILILIFAVPIIFMAYIGFVVNPGLDLVQNRMTQHQADYAALSLRWECQQDSECRAVNQNPGTANPSGWPAPYAHTPGSLSDRIVLRVLQLITLSGNAHAQTGGCQPPDCLRGTKKIMDGKVYMRFESDQDIRNRNLNAAAEAAMEAGVSDFEAPEINGDIFDGFFGCEKVTIKGNSEIVGNVYTTEPGSEISVKGNSEIVGNVYTTEPGSEISVKGNATVEGEVQSAGRLDGDGISKIAGSICIKDDFRTDLIRQGFSHSYDFIVLGDLRARQDMNIGGSLKVGGTLEITSHVDSMNVVGNVQYGIDCSDNNKTTICSTATQNSGIICPGDEDPKSLECDPIADTEGTWEEIDGFFNLYSEAAESTSYSDIDDFSEISGGYYKFESLDLKSDLMITGDTVLHVEGDFKLTGNNTLSVKEGASLTLMVEGDIKFTSGEITAETLVNEDEEGRTRPQVTILAKGGEVDLAGNGNLTGVIYAPKSDVKIRGTQSVTGSVRGKTLDINGTPGAEAIEYDDALKDVETIGGFSDTSTKPFLVK
ncbi:MAG: hypothetical protein VBE63_13015 [Lamprobacter sp.]|uniref:DUF7305 domain-containing protein n=1 Tax=Lamprobacter sp. TaxID=3100796 RepID=UPI002B25786C|nr:hypothetical protein [Lamprobacter sp.]MEA3640849.1 hypothetical protein [Lamprobacter sp.]